ncbi:MAG TPA: hypothetical protein VK009_15065 [Chloroflexota bacterium]|nr:hypothetical protein [Chloroflexota bacterium]
MQQPIIDLEKVNAWTESMRHAFGGNDIGTWLVIAFTVAFVGFVAFTAWQVNREAKHRV